MDPDIKARLTELNDLIQKEKDPEKFQELVNQLLRLLDGSEGHKQDEKSD